MAIKEALAWIRDRSKTNVIVEYDCEFVVNAINEMSRINSGFGLIVDDCKVILSTLTNVRVELIYRPANRTAHVPAGEGGSNSGPYVWRCIPSNFISVALTEDIME